jgi:hypothetical protein
VCPGGVESTLESPLCVGGVEVHLFLWVFRVSADSLQCHCGMDGSRTFDFDEAFPGVFVSQALPCYAQQTGNPTLSLLGPRRVVS